MGKREREVTQALVAGKKPKNPVVITARAPDSVPARIFGIGLAGVGAAHFTTPEAFDPLTGRAFPHDTRRWTYRNGASELAIGLAMISRRTRPLGGIGLVAYLAFLATRYASL